MKPLKGAIRVLLFHRHPVVMEGLKKVLTGEPRFAYAGEASDAKEALSRCAKIKPDVVMVGIESPDDPAFQMIRDLRQSNPRMGILVLTSFHEIDLLLTSFRSGANGYLLKDAGVFEILRAIQNLGNGMGYIPPSMIAPLLQKTLRSTPPANDIKLNLTEREHEVFRLLAEGADSGEIGERLVISAKTALSHRARIMKKLGLSNHTELVKLAMAKGIIGFSTIMLLLTTAAPYAPFFNRLLRCAIAAMPLAAG